MRRIISRTRAAVDDYKMIADGDKIAVGVSGGKDSLLLLKALCELKRFYPAKFTIVAITLDMRFGCEDGDFSAIKEMCDSYGVEYVVKPTDLYEIIFEVRKEPNPCSLCARMRRGILHDTAKELGCNKIALGHHLDDAIETFYMNLWNEGRIGTFSPVTYLSIKDITMIRPFVLAIEQDVIRAVNEIQMPIVESKCPADGVTNRQNIKNWVMDRCREDTSFRAKSLNAFQKKDLDGWGLKNKG